MTTPEETGKLPDPTKDKIIEALSSDSSVLKKYQTFFVGRPGLGATVRYETAMLLAAQRSGALGYLLRKTLYPKLFGSAGNGLNFGRGISLRCPSRMQLGDNVAIDDDCALDARGAKDAGDFKIGANTLIARRTELVVKQGYIRIGTNCSIGSQSTISAVSGIEIGDYAIIAGQCYLGGGRYKNVLGDGPMVTQGHETRGPVVLGDDVWLGAGARVIDGVSIGTGAIIGTGAVVTSDIPPNVIAVGMPARVIGERK